MYAGGGDKPNALREAKRAVELEGDDTYYAPAAEEALAIVEAQTGETASAIARLPQKHSCRGRCNMRAVSYCAAGLTRERIFR